MDRKGYAQLKLNQISQYKWKAKYVLIITEYLIDVEFAVLYTHETEMPNLP